MGTNPPTDQVDFWKASHEDLGDAWLTSSFIALQDNKQANRMIFSPCINLPKNSPPLFDVTIV